MKWTTECRRHNGQCSYGEWTSEMPHDVLEAIQYEIYEKDLDFGEIEVGGATWAWRKRVALKYTIDGPNGQRRTATSKEGAILAARLMCRVPRIYRGAEYAHEDGGTTLDLWIDARSARREMGVPADCVVTW